MAIADTHRNHRAWRLCPFWQSATASYSSSSTQNLHNQSQSHSHQNGAAAANSRSSSTVSSVARSLLPARRRLRLDPNNLYFPYEPGKQARSAVRIKNSSKSYVAFKFQTTSPKSCYMRPPGGVLAPGESLTATVFKFVEHPENNDKSINQSKVKFKIMSLKVKQGSDYIPELFDEQRDQVTVERILRVVFLDPESTNPVDFFELGQTSGMVDVIIPYTFLPSPRFKQLMKLCTKALEKLKCQLTEADAELEASKKKPSADAGPRVNGEGLVLDEWKERREKYLARQQVEAVDSV